MPDTSSDASGISAGAQESGACPRGLVWSGGACRSRREADRGQCNSAEGVNECREMCEEHQDWGACTNLGVAYIHGRYIELDRARALALFERACGHGEGTACYNLSGMLLVGMHGVPADRKRGLELAIKACQAEPTHCSTAAIAYRDGLGIAKNPGRSAELFSRACIGGRAASCWDLARAYQQGSGVEKDLARAHELTQAACNGGFMRSCANVAGQLMLGNGVRQDDRRALEWARYACETGRVPFGCSIVGYFHVYGRGGLRKDHRKGWELMKWACENDPDGNTCEIIGETLRSHRKEADAKYYLQKACDAGQQTACKRVNPPPAAEH